MSVFCTFILPSVGRSTIDRTIKSIVDQTDSDWNAMVVGDGLGGNWSPGWQHCKIWSSVVYPKVGTGNFGGEMRNHAMRNAVGEWFAFVDDDDRVDINYVSWLKEESKNSDVVVFRMRFDDGRILPSEHGLSCGGVGISFAVKSQFQRDNNIWFIPGETEDWTMLEQFGNKKAQIHVSDRVAYYVRH